MMIFHNEDVRSLIAEIPEGHKHLRCTIRFSDGSEMTLQEATVANLVRAYIRIKTHPHVTRIIMKGEHREQRKDGFASWQLLESDIE